MYTFIYSCQFFILTVPGIMALKLEAFVILELKSSVIYFPKHQVDLSQSHLLWFIYLFVLKVFLSTFSFLLCLTTFPFSGLLNCFGAAGSFEDMNYSRPVYSRWWIQTNLIYSAVSLLRRPEIMWVHYREWKAFTLSRWQSPVCQSLIPQLNVT